MDRKLNQATVCVATIYAALLNRRDGRTWVVVPGPPPKKK